MAATKSLRISVPNPRMGIIDVKLDNSYPTGGYALAPSDFGLTAIEMVLTQAVGGYDYEYDYSTKKLKAYRVNTTGAVLGEVPAATDLSAVTVRVTAFGY